MELFHDITRQAKLRSKYVSAEYNIQMKIVLISHV